MKKERRTIVPFKAKIVEPIRLLSRKEREERIQRAGLNVFRLDSEDVYIDLLTDSGTGALSCHQQSRMMVGDESYAGSKSFRELERQAQETFGLPHVLPVHQGRAAERLLNIIMIQPHQFVPGNTHFDTTKAHIEYARGRCIDVTIEVGRHSRGYHPFKGNLDIDRLKAVIEEHGSRTMAYVLITATCNSGGGQPVSLKNIKETAAVCRKYDVPLFIDAARFAENAYFIKAREDEYKDASIQEIVLEMFSKVDGLLMSSKKDAISPMGGLLIVRNNNLFDRLKTITILFEGFITYGGMSGLMMESLAQGLREVVDEDYLAFRIGQVANLASMLKERGEIPIVEPPGGHAVFIDARRFFKNVPEDQFPAQLLCVELYREGGIRPVEVGSCHAGRNPDTGENVRPALDLCRLAIPRRVYSLEHFIYVADVAADVKEQHGNRDKGLKFKYESPGMRLFDSLFSYVD